MPFRIIFSIRIVFPQAVFDSFRGVLRSRQSPKASTSSERPFATLLILPLTEIWSQTVALRYYRNIAGDFELISIVRSRNPQARKSADYVVRRPENIIFADYLLSTTVMMIIITMYEL